MNKNEFGISESLDKKIQMIIEEGEISDDDRLYIHECAKEEGLSERDVDFYMNRLIKQKQKQKGIVEKEVEYERKKKEAIGNICPKCGKQIPPMSIACPYCGTQIFNKEANSAVKELADKINEIQQQDDYKQQGNQRIYVDKEKQIAELISIFPVPNTKEDIIEFLALAAPNAKTREGIFNTIGGRLLVLTSALILIAVLTFIVSLIANDYHLREESFGPPLFVLMFGFLFFVLPFSYCHDKDTIRWNKRAKIWKAKFDQVLMKAHTIKGDSDFINQISYFENSVK